MTGLPILLSNLVRLLLWPVAASIRALRRRPAARYVFLRLPARISEFAPLPRTLLQLWARRRDRWSTSSEKIRQVLDQVRHDPRMEGVVVELQRTHASWAVLGGVRRAVLELRSAGKNVVFYLPEGAGDRELYVASAGDKVFSSPASSFLLLGVAAEPMYISGLLQRIGVRVQVNAQGDFKTAAEGLTRREMSPFQREQLRAVLDCRHRLLAEAVSQRLDPGVSSDALFEAAHLSPTRAVEVGLASGTVYEDGLPAVLGQEARGIGWAMTPRSYQAFRPRPVWRSSRTYRYIAIVTLMGPIRGHGFAPPGEGIVTAPTVALLRAARRDRRVAGVLLYVDSPGGSALASDLIHHEVERLAGEKPVVACLGGVAASGGYYIAAPAHHIVAAPETITGSIGVVSVRLVADQLLTRLGVHPQVVRSAPHADMMSIARAWDDFELSLFDQEGKRCYDRFVDVVATGRGLSREDVLAAAGGRVWNAQDACTRGLVDGLGDIGEALSAVRERVGLPDAATMEAKRFRPKGRAGTGIEAPAPNAHGGLSRGSLWRERQLWALLSAREPVLCYCLATSLYG